MKNSFVRGVAIACLLAISLAALCGCGSSSVPGVLSSNKASVLTDSVDLFADSESKQSYDVGDYTIKVLDKTRNVAIERYNGTETEVNIPAELDGYPVSYIETYAFVWVSSLEDGDPFITSVVVPDSVTMMGSSVFSGQTALQSVVLPAGLTTIGYSSFNDCVSLAAATIPDSITAIPDKLFHGCTSLKSCTLPGTVTYLGSDVFGGCTALEQANIPSGITKIPDGLFNGCSALTEAVIPEGTTSIGESAFSGCKTLQYLTIPSSVKSIGSIAFHGTADTFEIRCDEGSYAQDYAVENYIKYRLN